MRKVKHHGQTNPTVYEAGASILAAAAGEILHKPSERGYPDQGRAVNQRTCGAGGSWLDPCTSSTSCCTIPPGADQRLPAVSASFSAGVPAADRPRGHIVVKVFRSAQAPRGVRWTAVTGRGRRWAVLQVVVLGVGDEPGWVTGARRWNTRASSRWPTPGTIRASSNMLMWRWGGRSPPPLQRPCDCRVFGVEARRRWGKLGRRARSSSTAWSEQCHRRSGHHVVVLQPVRRNVTWRSAGRRCGGAGVDPHEVEAEPGSGSGLVGTQSASFNTPAHHRAGDLALLTTTTPAARSRCRFRVALFVRPADHRSGRGLASGQGVDATAATSWGRGDGVDARLAPTRGGGTG